MIKVKDRTEDELKRFEKVFGVPIDAPKTCKIYIQGDYLVGNYSFEEDGRVISIYCKNFSRLIPPPNHEGYEIKKINIRRGSYNVCLDMEYPARNSIQKKYVDERENVLAVVDYCGNIHFIDFIHSIYEGKDFLPVFFEILRQEEHPLAEEWWVLFCEHEISKIIYPEIVKTVRTLGIARKTKKIIEEELQSQYDIQISILMDEIERLKQEEAKRVEKEIWGAFLDGVFIADGKLWKVDNGFLEYKKRINALYIKKDNRIVRAPEKKYFINGIKIKYSPDDGIIAQAIEWFHPNVSERGTVCLGDIKDSNKSFLEQLKRIHMLPTLLQTINLDSCYDVDAKEKAWKDWENEKEEISEVFDLAITTE